MNRQYGALSGVAIFLIVLNHAIHFGLQVAPVDRPWFQALVVLQALGVFAVPVFLFVSGGFLAYASREFTATFIRSSLERILWPYLIWSVVFYTIELVGNGQKYSIVGLARNLAVGYPFHFVPLLVFWYLTTPIVVWLGRRRGAWLLAGIGLWQAWLLLLRFPEMFALDGRLPGWTALTAPPVLFTSMADWGIFFPLGLVMSLHGPTLKPYLRRWRGVAAGLSVALFVLGLLNAFRWVEAPWARLIAALPLMFALPTIERASIPGLDFFERLGRRSYGTYLTHFVLLNVLVSSIERGLLPLHGRPLVVFPLCFAVALGGSQLLLTGTARHPLGRRFYRYLFGIVPPPEVVQRRSNGDAAAQ